MEKAWPNKANAAKPAIKWGLRIGDQSRGLADSRRYAWPAHRRLMKVFYHGCAHLADVASESPVERSEEEALVLLNRLHCDGAFLGLELDDGFVLQFMYEQGAIHTEMINRKSRSLEFCTLSIPLAEDSIRAASRGRPIKQVAEGACIDWRREQLA